MSFLRPKISFLITGLSGLGYGLSTPLINSDNYKSPKGPYIVVKLGEYESIHELTISGKEIFIKAGEWMEWKDFLSFSIDDQILDGEYMFTSSNDQSCLTSENNDSKWCWKKFSLRREQYSGSWKLRDLLYKFNIEGVSYFPEDNWHNLEYKIHINKIGEQGCSLENKNKCAAGSKEFDLKRGKLV